MPRIPTFSLLACSLLLSACAPAGSLTRAPVATVEPVAGVAAPANDNLNAVLWVQRSDEYRALALQTWRAAARLLDQAVADPHWNALLPEEGGARDTRGLKPAVVVDVDETVLDNSPYQARLVVDGSSYNDATWEAWVAERKAKPVPGAVEFARAAAAKGVTMVYITNRTEAMKQDTLANLRQAGFPVADDSVYLGLGMSVPGCEQRGSEKGCRRQLVARKYRVLMQFGDQITDFVQITDNRYATRRTLMEQHDAWLGQRWWVIPGPTYGGWEAAAFNNKWSLPEDIRRQAKRDALELETTP
ncbi:MAG: 5'-nucleotidase, lipoprotein e(P4) family [Stenotrophomonas sp.]